MYLSPCKIRIWKSLKYWVKLSPGTLNPPPGNLSGPRRPWQIGLSVLCIVLLKWYRYAVLISVSVQVFMSELAKSFRNVSILVRGDIHAWYRYPYQYHCNTSMMYKYTTCMGLIRIGHICIGIGKIFRNVSVLVGVSISVWILRENFSMKLAPSERIEYTMT